MTHCIRCPNPCVPHRKYCRLCLRAANQLSKAYYWTHRTARLAYHQKRRDTVVKALKFYQAADQRRAQ